LAERHRKQKKLLVTFSLLVTFWLLVNKAAIMSGVEWRVKRKISKEKFQKEFEKMVKEADTRQTTTLTAP
jgi:hypothetical protein